MTINRNHIKRIFLALSLLAFTVASYAQHPAAGTFSVIPRLNAAGRMGEADKAAELLLSSDPAEAARLARELCALNRERQSVEQEIYAQALEMIEHLPEEERYALVLSSDAWHQGVVGIVASRLSEKYACPSFMIHLSDGVGKGSCRSWGGFNLFAALESCQDLLLGFGGHELAAGFTIEEGNIPAFRARMNQYARKFCGGQTPVSVLDVDVPILHPGRVTLQEVEELRALERANLDTQAQRAELLTAYHLPVDYTDDIYTCPRCHDTGYVQGQPCECLLRRYNAELTRDLSRLLQHGDESFEHFDLTLYDENARPKMERVFQVCRSFAQTFRPGTMNLLLQGGTGLGKTYLSACIARVVAGAGYAVAYETAASAFDAFECAKFQRGSADGEAAAQRVEQYLGCDLMILDDLGTEMITAYSTSALYTLINTRLTRAKATIISTNCSNEELQKKYTPQILSRIEGEYQTLPFVGRDIRQIKKEREA